jgi:hypothetical protein
MNVKLFSRQITSVIGAASVDNGSTPTSKNVDFLTVDFCPRKTLDFDADDDDDEDEEVETEEEEELVQPEPEEEIARPDLEMKNKRLPPPPVPPRISSLAPAVSSPLSQKIASSK